jgi:parallel beta-helix repeat protein
MNGVHRGPVAVIIGSIIIAAAVLAGPLNPPAGPVASTYKTLSDVEPRIAINSVNTPGDAVCLFKITQPGSYYVTGNITGAAGKRGIEISSSGVSLDLMGFDLVGVPGSLQGIAVISAPTILFNVSVRNGSIRSWGSNGVDLIDASGSPTYTAQQSELRDLRATGNGGFGLRCGDLGSIKNCYSSLNTTYGIIGGFTAEVSHCTAVRNTSDGITGCAEGMISDCEASDNQGRGIYVPNGRCTITGCTVLRSGTDGIFTAQGGVISNCDVMLNSRDGIVGANAAFIQGNVCISNGLAVIGAGIHVTGQQCRVEGNSCVGNEIGIKVDGASNLIIRNSATSSVSSAFTIAAGNTTGTVVTTEANMNAAANANVNITY